VIHWDRWGWWETAVRPWCGWLGWYEGFEVFDRFVGDPAGADAQGFADAFAEDVSDSGFGVGDAVGPRTAVIGLVTEHHAHVGLSRDAEANAAGE
jgi:hypothetical protein